jgi:hypothetical protein
MHQRAKRDGFHIHPRAGKAALTEILLDHLDRCRVRLQHIPDDRVFRNLLVSHFNPPFDFKFKISNFRLKYF